ncbi:MAG: hypothetical protein ABSB59_07825 [Streptosporangiaceae bacterium]|jgi:hypothetical protein
MKTGAKAASRRVDRTENAVYGVLMAAWMGASPFVAYAAGRWADGTFSRAAQAQRAALRQVPATLLEASHRRGHGTGGVPDTLAEWRGPDGLLRTGLVFAPAGAKAGSRVTVWINQAGDAVAPPMQQAQIAKRVELAQGLAAASFAVGLGMTGWLTRQRLERCQRSV